MGRARNDADRLAFQAGGRRVERRRFAAHDKARRRTIIGRGEIELVARRRGRGERGGDRVALTFEQRIDDRVPAARLNRAGDLQFLANGARQVDVEAGERTIGQREIERRIVVVGQEAYRPQAGKIRAIEMKVRIPEARRLDAGVLRLGRRRRGAGRRRQQENIYENKSEHNDTIAMLILNGLGRRSKAEIRV